MAEALVELGFAVEVIETMEDAGRWPDLTRLAARRPDALRAAVWMLGHSVPVRDICEALKLSPCTVQSIADQQGEAVVSQKRQVAARRRLAIQLSMEHMVERARKGELNAFDTKLLWDMEQVESGGVTDRREQVHGVDVTEAEAFYERLKALAGGGQAGMVLDAEVISPTAPTPSKPAQLADQGPIKPLSSDPNPL